MRSSLLVGLLILVVVAAGPAFAVLLNLQSELRGEREALARTVALQQAEMVNAAVGRVVDDAHNLVAIVSGLDVVQRMDPSCDKRLDRLRAEFPAYRMFAVLRADGTVVCTSATQPIAPADVQAVASPLLAITGFSTGTYTTVPGLDRPVLSFALPFSTVGKDRAGIVLAGLDLEQVAGALTTAQGQPGGRTIIRDVNGTVIARQPADLAALGERVAGPDGAAMQGTVAGSILLQRPNAPADALGYVPSGRDPVGLSVAVEIDLAQINSGIDRVQRRGTLLILAAVACSFFLALLYGQRYLRAPAAVLLRAAGRWGGGELSARAQAPPGAAAELAQLASAFNEMAKMLQEQRTELQGLNEALEVRVSERTRALLDSNNRLQIEIAERELTESALRQAQKQQAVGQLADGMASDFSELLTVMTSSLSRLRTAMASDDTRQIQLVDQASQAVERGSRITAQLLAFSRKQPLVEVTVNLADAIEGMAGLLASTLGPTIRVQARAADGLWPVVLDPNQFDAALLNLALNARDAMPAGGRLSITANNTVIPSGNLRSDLPPGDYARIIISDAGVGMPPDVQFRAMEPFFTTKAPGKGAGLGLSQVQGMVRQSGGSVHIESRPGDGTVVTILLPRAGAGFAADNPGSDPTPALGRDSLVLLVDDDEQVRELTATMLRESGYAVATAADAAASLAILEQDGDRVGLLIADHSMPGMTGRDLVRLVRQRFPHVRVLLASGYGDLPDLIGEDLSADQVVRKPFRAGELLARIRIVCHRPATAEAQVLAL